MTAPAAMVLLQAVRVLDPGSGRDEPGCDVLIEGSRIAAIGRGLPVPPGAAVWSRPGSVVTPGFLDLHCHLRDPGAPDKETVGTGTAAAARGGFAAVCAMANHTPPLDDPTRLAAARAHDRGRALVPVHRFAACTRELAGVQPVDVDGCVAAGAAGFSDDGRHALGPAQLEAVLRAAAHHGRVVAIHPEDEDALAAVNSGGSPTTWAHRPAGAEEAAVRSALAVLRAVAGAGARLHLQHLSTTAAVAALRAARAEGLPVTGEVTPHHLALDAPPAGPPAGPWKVNPPLRGPQDRRALWAAVRDGTIQAIATDHAPHEAAAKTGDPWRDAAGISGLETALAVCLGLPGAADALPQLVTALTVGPWEVLGAATGVMRPALRVGGPATCTWFDPQERWTPAREADAWCSRGRNTPFWTVPLTGRVLATLIGGRSAYRAVAAPAEPVHA